MDNNDDILDDEIENLEQEDNHQQNDYINNYINKTKNLRNKKLDKNSGKENINKPDNNSLIDLNNKSDKIKDPQNLNNNFNPSKNTTDLQNPSNNSNTNRLNLENKNENSEKSTNTNQKESNNNLVENKSDKNLKSPKTSTSVNKGATKNPTSAVKNTSSTTGKATKSPTSAVKNAGSPIGKATKNGVANFTTTITTASTKFIAFLVAHPPVAIGLLIGIIAIFLIFVIIMFLAGDTNTKVTDYNEKYQNNPSNRVYNGRSYDYLLELEYTTETGTTDEEEICYKVENHNGDLIVGPNFSNNHIASEEVSRTITNRGWQEYFEVENASDYYLIENTCIPTTVVEDLVIIYLIEEIENNVIDILEYKNIELEIHEQDAIILLAYSEGNEYIEPLISSYANKNYEELWDTMMSIGVDEYSENLTPEQEQEQIEIMKRRKSEFSLFVTGDYQDIEYNFYEGRALEEDEKTNEIINMTYTDYYEEYYDYDSEDVTSRNLLSYSTNGEYWLPIGNYTDVNGMSPGNPSAGVYISSYFREPDRPTHRGIDLTISGTHSVFIIAAKSGVVIKTGNCGHWSYGNCVMIRHDDNSTTLYAHMANSSVRVAVNQVVTQGQILGIKGNTGNSDGAHLHFEIQVGGILVDPIYYVSITDPRPTKIPSTPDGVLDQHVPL